MPDGKYRLFALTRDQIGNEAASPEYQVVTFDNVGPNVTGLTVRDVSPLPFPSTNPVRFISDVAQFGGATITDPGIGFDPSAPFVANIGSQQISLNVTNIFNPVNGVISSVVLGATTFDTNPISDGPYNIGLNSFTDALGNLPTYCAPQAVVIDNTDPTVTFNRFTASGVVESGSQQSIETLSSDSTSGVYTSILFWNDFTDLTNPGRASRSRANGFVGAPVEIQRIYKGLDLAA